MPTLYITEFAGCGNNERGGLNPLVQAPSVADQIVNVGSASAQSASLNATTSIVRVSADSNCNIKFGTNPTAKVATMRLAAGSVEYIGVPTGGTLKIAVIVGS